MKRIVMVALAVVLVTAIALGSATAFAAKPQSNGSGKDVIAISNGFPSGEHFNLNIHGKKDGFICDPTPGGGSVFVDEVGPATIQYVTSPAAIRTGRLLCFRQNSGETQQWKRRRCKFGHLRP